jgi:hypothetical protein
MENKGSSKKTKVKRRGDNRPVTGGANITVGAGFIGRARRALREWWFEIQRRFHDYSCYGIFLILPSDKEASRYLYEYGAELDTISRDSCVIIFLSDENFQRPKINSNEWQDTVKKHISIGGNTKIAQLFEIEYDKFPSLVLFEDIRSNRHVIVSLKDMSAEEIASKLRTVFSVTQKAVSNKQEPLQLLEKYRSNERLHKAGSSIMTGIRNLAGNTMETAIEAWVKATIQ